MSTVTAGAVGHLDGHWPGWPARPLIAATTITGADERRYRRMEGGGLCGLCRWHGCRSPARSPEFEQRPANGRAHGPAMRRPLGASSAPAATVRAWRGRRFGAAQRPVLMPSSSAPRRPAMMKVHQQRGDPPRPRRLAPHPCRAQQQQGRAARRGAHHQRKPHQAGPTARALLHPAHHGVPSAAVELVPESAPKLKQPGLLKATRRPGRWDQRNRARVKRLGPARRPNRMRPLKVSAGRRCGHRGTGPQHWQGCRPAAWPAPRRLADHQWVRELYCVVRRMGFTGWHRPWIHAIQSARRAGGEAARGCITATRSPGSAPRRGHQRSPAPRRLRRAHRSVAKLHIRHCAHVQAPGGLMGHDQLRRLAIRRGEGRLEDELCIVAARQRSSPAWLKPSAAHVEVVDDALRMR